MTEADDKYWHKTFYCLQCKKVTKHLRCDNCGKFMCYEHSDKADPEYGDYGSILDKGGYPVHDC